MLKRSLFVFIGLLLLASCRDGNRQVEVSDSTSVTRTEHPSSDKTDDSKPVDIGTPNQDTASHGTTSDLPPVATPVEPDRLASFLPQLDGYTPEDVQKETRIRPNMKVSKATRVYKNGDKKVTVTINDYAYVPSQYLPYEQYRGEYLQDDNVERTESTRISGYEAVQTWLKKENRAEITLFPGKRYVVQLTADGMNDVSEARRVLDAMNLSGLEDLQ
jgi:hypothetical protein